MSCLSSFPVLSFSFCVSTHMRFSLPCVPLRSSLPLLRHPPILARYRPELEYVET